jgi:D-alanyl-lipoteichoic acid acyltransferase DltB (MBOAT superfamily)
LSGFWHGANWTFIAWGAYHALLFLPLILLGANRKYMNQVGTYTDASGSGHLRLLPTWRETLQILCTFLLAVLGWIIFRAETITQAWEYICGICCSGVVALPWMESAKTFLVLPVVLLTLILFEWFNRNKSHGLDIHSLKTPLRWAVYVFICGMILAFGAQPETFIYFQF